MRRWRTTLFAIGLGAGVLLFAGQVWSSYQALRAQEVILLHPPYLIGGGAAVLLFYALQVLAWTSIMRFLGVSVDLREALRGYFLSFLPRYIPGSVWGYWGRSHWLERTYGVSYTTSLLGSVLEALALTLTGAGIASGYAALRWEGSSRFVAVLGCAGTLGAAWLAVPYLVTWLGTKYDREVSRAHHEKPALANWSAVLALYLALWTVYGSSIFLIANSVAPTRWADLPGTVFASSLSWVTGFVAVVVPAGLGVRELTFSALLPLHTGFLPWQARVIAVVSRVSILLAEIAFLVIGLGLQSGDVEGRASKTLPEVGE